MLHDIVIIIPCPLSRAHMPLSSLLATLTVDHEERVGWYFSMNAFGSVLIVVVFRYDLNAISVACKVSL